MKTMKIKRKNMKDMKKIKIKRIIIKIQLKKMIKIKTNLAKKKTIYQMMIEKINIMKMMK